MSPKRQCIAERTSFAHGRVSPERVQPPIFELMHTNGKIQGQREVDLTGNVALTTSECAFVCAGSVHFARQMQVLPRTLVEAIIQRGLLSTPIAAAESIEEVLVLDVNESSKAVTVDRCPSTIPHALPSVPLKDLQPRLGSEAIRYQPVARKPTHECHGDLRLQNPAFSLHVFRQHWQ